MLSNEYVPVDIYQEAFDCTPETRPHCTLYVHCNTQHRKIVSKCALQFGFIFSVYSLRGYVIECRVQGLNNRTRPNTLVPGFANTIYLPSSTDINRVQ